ncbi:hypothetical protein O3M35_007296 [Rhynocoris fuscipes]|uniref:Uncharacterized protein n=1 Tax=Rhynocoris fuscipes TaxID=488301 RepID=A0AAW1DBL3_9HEMI
MQLFAFCTTWRCAGYIKISSDSGQQCYQQNSSKLRILCLPHLKNGSSQLKSTFLNLSINFINLSIESMIILSFFY